MDKIEEKIKEILEKVDNKGFLKKREGNDVEYKESFGISSLSKYIKTFASFANKKGGVIIFGIKDSPHKKIGLQNDNFEKFDNAELSKYLNDIFEPEILFEKGILDIDNFKFGYYYIKESNNKPIIAKKAFGNNQDIKEGEIYFRYNARNEKIRYPELRNILDTAKKQFENDWFNIIKNISNIGVNNVNLINLKNGDTFNKNDKYLILDPKILDCMNYIKEGKFVETDGLPTLTLKGNLEINDKAKIIEIDKKTNFPYTKSMLHEKLKFTSKLYEKACTPYYLEGILIKLNIINNDCYHYKDITGKRITNLYSEEAFNLCINWIVNEENKLNDENIDDKYKIVRFKSFLKFIVKGCN